MKKTPFLVTGATGFVGRHLLQALSQDPEVQPIALVRDKKSWAAQNWTHGLKGVELIEGSVTEPKKWKDDPRLQSLGGIYHLAAVIKHTRREPEEMLRTNVEGLLRMVELGAERNCRVLFVSTSGTVGCFATPDRQADEKSPYQEATVGSWPYYASKIRAEREGRKLSESLGVELVILRPPVLLGPGDHRMRATSHIARLLRGKLPFIVNGGMHFVDIRDVTQAMLRAMRISHPKPVYHLCGTTYRIEAFFQKVAELGGVPPPKLQLPPLAAKLLAKTSGLLDRFLPPRPHPILPDPVVFEMASKHWGLSSLYAKEDLGFVSRNPETTLRDTIQWLKENIPELKEKAAAELGLEGAGMKP
ncbi:MAG: NAD-dependent epimerase/dehydratase family protein [Deltaproteobacteria bacterium]|nr:NAD-dependent epimerase/dehydratase family protein [Deltaproteobacteria bacterium]